MDHELLCGEWETSKHGKSGKSEGVSAKRRDVRFQRCFRSDSNWVGVDFVEHAGFESMIGITDSAQIYVAHKPHLLAP